MFALTSPDGRGAGRGASEWFVPVGRSHSPGPQDHYLTCSQHRVGALAHSSSTVGASTKSWLRRCGTAVQGWMCAVHTPAGRAKGAHCLVRPSYRLFCLPAGTPTPGRWAWFWRAARSLCVPLRLWSCVHPATRARPRPPWAPARNRTTESSLRTRSRSSTASSSS